MKLFFVFSLLAVGLTQAQNKSDIVKIEFSSITRGHQEFLTITPDSINWSTSGKPAEHNKMKKDDWASIIKAVKNVALEEISNLKSPTMKRAYDGARHSTITITTPSQTYSHSFDDENPHEKLRSLLKIILDKRKKISAK